MHDRHTKLMRAALADMLRRKNEGLPDRVFYSGGLLTARSLKIRGLIEPSPYATDRTDRRTFRLTIKGQQFAKRFAAEAVR